MAGTGTNITIEVTVDADAQGVLWNNADVTSTTAGGDASTSENTTVDEWSYLSVAKSDAGYDPVVAGETVVYTLSVTNPGPSDAREVVVYDTLPADVTYVWSGGASSESGGIVTWTVGTLPAGQGTANTIQVSVQSSATGPLTNEAEVVTSAYDPDTGDNTVEEITTVQQRSDLAVTKQASTNLVLAGETLTYWLTVTNLGPSVANGVVVTDTLPAEVSFVSGSAGCSEDGGTVTCSAGMLETGVGTNFTILVATDSGAAAGPITNTALAVSDNVDPDTGNSSTSVVVTVALDADLTIVKSAQPATAVAGTELTYRLAVTNFGPSDAAGVVVTDALPAHVTFDDDQSTEGCTESEGTVTCSIGTLPASSSTSITIVVDVASSFTGSLTNDAVVGSAVPDTAALNNSASVQTPVIARSDLVVGKSDSVDPVVAGSNMTYTIAVTNLGPSDAVGVVVTDSLPDMVVFVSGSPGCVDQGWRVICDAGDMVAGATTSFVVQVHVMPSGLELMTNEVLVASDVDDPDSGNNRADETTAVDTLADLFMEQSASMDEVMAGLDQQLYTIGVSNAGPSDAHDVTLTDILPDDVTFDPGGSTPGWVLDGSGDAPQGGGGQGTTGSGGTYRFDIGLLSAGARSNVVLAVTVDSSADGQIENAVSVSSSTGDPDSSDNSVAEQTDVRTEADLSVGKTDSADPVYAGSNLTYTIGVTNDGPSDARSLRVTDALPPGVTFVPGSSTAGWVLNGQTLTYEPGTLAEGGTLSLTVVVNVPNSDIDDLLNIVTVSSDARDPDTADNGDSAETRVTSNADLQLSKSASVGTVVPGNKITYTIEVDNNGPQLAADVVVTDTLPAGVRFSPSGSTPGCTESGGVVTCPLGTLADSGSASVTIVVHVDPLAGEGAVLVNSASVSSRATDGTSGNDSDTAQTTVTLPNAIYDFEHLSLADLIGQDNWSRDTTTISASEQAYMDVTNGAGYNVTQVMNTRNTGIPDQHGDAQTMRINDGNFAFATFTSNETAGVYQFDVQYHEDQYEFTESMMMAPLAHPTGDGDMFFESVRGPGFGIEFGQFSIWPAGSSFAAASAPPPSRISDGDWLRLRLVVDFTANAHDGAASLSYKDLTLGDGPFTPLCTASFGMGISFVSFVYPPETWQGIWVQSSHWAGPGMPGPGAMPADNIQIGEADLSITKSDNVDPVAHGGNVTYTVTVDNSGPNGASGVSVDDLLPRGAALVSATPSQGTTSSDGPMLSWDVGTLNSSANATLTVVVTLSESGTVTNSARVSSAMADPNAANNTVAETTTVNALPDDVDLVVTKTDSEDPLITTSNLIYTIDVENQGTTIASGVVVTDALPAGVIFDAAGSTAGWSLDGGALTYAAGSLGAGASTALTVRVTVANTTTGLISNTASAAADQADANASDNTDTETTLVPDSDGDGIPDFADTGGAPDFDNDGIPNSLDPDDDNDGMSDEYENRHSLNPFDPSDAGINSDTDKFLNIEEYIADTDPRDGNSYLRITAITPVGGGVEVNFNSSSQRVYTLQYSLDIRDTGAWHDVPGQADVPGVGGPQTLSDSSGDEVRYYRLLVDLPAGEADADNDGIPDSLDPDDDNDGMSDEYENAHSLDPFNAADAGIDTDLDTFLNIEEYIADTDPRDSDSYLRITGITLGGGLTVHFDSSAQREYTLQYSLDIVDTGGWNNVPGQVDVPGAGGTDSLIDGSPEPVRYYRIRVDLP